MLESLSARLVGTRVRLEPLSLGHSSDLAAIAAPEVMRYMVNWRVSDPFAEVVSQVLDTPGLFPFAIVLQESGKAVGSSSYLDVRPEHRSLEIGATWIAPAHQGTFVNPEIKLLMLGHAFETLGCGRVQLKTDARNEQSRRAMLKLGCTFEGVLRKHMVLPDGHVRDTAYFSILDTEWPSVRLRLLVRLESL